MISVVFPLEISFTLFSCSADIGFLTSFPGHPPNLKSSSSIFHCPCSLSVSFFHFESTIEPWSFWVFSTPFQSLFTLITSQWESCALYSFWAPNWCFSIFCTLTLLYTNITELNLSKHLPTGWLWSFHLNHIIFFIYVFILFFIIFIYSLTTSRPIAPGLLLLLYLNVEQLWQHCHIILYDQTTDFYFTLWVFHLFNKWPTTCMQCIDLCHRVTLTWPMGACHWFGPLNEGTTLVVVSFRLVCCLILLTYCI